MPGEGRALVIGCSLTEPLGDPGPQLVCAWHLPFVASMVPCQLQKQTDRQNLLSTGSSLIVIYLLDTSCCGGGEGEGGVAWQALAAGCFPLGRHLADNKKRIIKKITCTLENVQYLLTAPPSLSV